MHCYLAVVFVAAVLGIVVGDHNGKWQGPPQAAGELESLKYEVLESHDEYELRRYGDVKVVATEMQLEDKVPSKEEQRTMFFRLFGYIDGQNDKDTKIPMTRPVINLVQNDGLRTMSFVVPEAFKEETPVPKQAEVNVKLMEVGDVYVKRFTRPTKIEANGMNEFREATVDALSKSGVTDAQYEPFYFVGYNAPFHPEQNYEVWFKKVVA